MQAAGVIRVIAHTGRAIQVPIALIALGLTASLIPTIRQLDSECVDNIFGIKCRRFSETLGGLRFSIGTVVLALVDVIVGLASMWASCIPPWLVATLDSMTAGFYIGSGSTIAARLNGELCDAGPSDPRFACGRLFAAMGFFFVGAVIGYALVICFWVLRAKRGHLCTTRADDGQALQNPFQDPTRTEPETVQGRVSKRRSWSQLS